MQREHGYLEGLKFVIRCSPMIVPIQEFLLGKRENEGLEA